MTTIISIHTPTQGVTDTNMSAKLRDYISIHTPTQGVTQGLRRSLHRQMLFQSTLPRRE